MLLNSFTHTSWNTGLNVVDMRLYMVTAYAVASWTSWIIHTTAGSINVSKATSLRSCLKSLFRISILRKAAYLSWTWSKAYFDTDYIIQIKKAKLPNNRAGIMASLMPSFELTQQFLWIPPDDEMERMIHTAMSKLKKKARTLSLHIFSLKMRYNDGSRQTIDKKEVWMGTKRIPLSSAVALLITDRLDQDVSAHHSFDSMHWSAASYSYHIGILSSIQRLLNFWVGVWADLWEGAFFLPLLSILPFRVPLSVLPFWMLLSILSFWVSHPPSPFGSSCGIPQRQGRG